MTATTVFDELPDALSRQEFDGTTVGIDLGTTKSCIAAAAPVGRSWNRCKATQPSGSALRAIARSTYVRPTRT